MESKPTRAWIKNHGDNGLIIAGCYLAAIHICNKRKSILSLLIIFTILVNITMHIKNKQRQEQSNISQISKQQSDRSHIDFTLLNAALSGNLANIEAALKQKANINARDKQGETALHLVAAIQPNSENEHDIVQIIKSLILNGANTDSTDNNGWTPLMEASYCAAYHGHTSIVSLLLSNGAKINTITKEGTTALMLASERKSDITKLLLDHKASLNVRDKYDHTALAIAIWAGNTKSISYLKSVGATN